MQSITQLKGARHDFMKDVVLYVLIVVVSCFSGWLVGSHTVPQCCRDRASLAVSGTQYESAAPVTSDSR